jgi:integrase
VRNRHHAGCRVAVERAADPYTLICEPHNLPHAGLHTLRHSAASVMITGGVPLKVVSEILGHSSIAITGDIYGHVSPDVARQAMDLLGDASTGSRSLSVTVQRASDAAPRACPSSSGSR